MNYQHTAVSIQFGRNSWGIIRTIISEDALHNEFRWSREWQTVYETEL